MYTKYVQ